MASSNKYEVEIGEGTVDNPSKVGALQHPNPKVVRIIHISDTHLQHNQYIEEGLIPDRDILVHSGDFTNGASLKKHIASREFTKDMEGINTFLGRLPHKHKIFVAGNHEVSLSYKTVEHIRASLTNGIYLQDESVVLEGIKFYGTPWNNYRVYAISRGFGLSPKALGDKWQLIPDDADILVTHVPPDHIMDKGGKFFFHSNSSCNSCPDSPHPSVLHWGCKYLRNTVLNRVRPAAHLFGHLHASNGLEVVDSVLFSNAAMAYFPRAKVIDFYMDPVGQS